MQKSQFYNFSFEISLQFNLKIESLRMTQKDLIQKVMIYFKYCFYFDIFLNLIIVLRYGYFFKYQGI